MSGSPGRRRLRPRSARGSVLVVALAMLSVLLLMPTASTSAQFQASLPAPAGSSGTGAWCIAPDPALAASPASSTLIPLNTLQPLASAPTTRMAIVPVAYSAAWNGGAAPGTASKQLAVRLWSCQETTATVMADSVRIVAWSNPATAVARAWSTGSDSALAPTSRLSTASGLGASLAALSTAASTEAVGLGNTGEARRFSWIVSNGRSAAAPTTDPAQCSWLISLIGIRTGSCTVALSSSPFSQSFNPNVWAGTTAAPVTYGARTFASDTWGANGSFLRENCLLGLLTCTSVPTDVSMRPSVSTPAQSYADLNGNNMIWVVIMWSGSVDPTDDLVAQIVLQ